MLGFDNHANAQRMNFLHNRIGDLIRKSLLHLQPAREGIDETGNLAEADHLLVRDVGDMAAPKKGQQMMFAEAEDFNIPDDHHLIVGYFEKRAVQHLIRILTVAAGEKAQGLSYASRCSQEA